MSFKLKGAKEMQQNLLNLSHQLDSNISSALTIEAELVMTEAKRDHVPVDLGVLRSSGYTQEVVTNPDGSKSITFGFGGAAKAYAIAIHENPSQYDPPSWRSTNVQFQGGKGRKYLEIPLRKAVADMPNRIANRLRIDK